MAMGPTEFDRIWLCLMKVLCKTHYTSKENSNEGYGRWTELSVLELFLKITTPASLSSSFWNAIQSSFCIQVSRDPKPVPTPARFEIPKMPLSQDRAVSQGAAVSTCMVIRPHIQLTAIHSHWAMQRPGRAEGTVESQAASPSWMLHLGSAWHSLLLSIQSHGNTHIRTGNHSENHLCLLQMKTC